MQIGLKNNDRDGMMRDWVDFFLPANATVSARMYVPFFIGSGGSFRTLKPCLEAANGCEINEIDAGCCCAVARVFIAIR